MAENTQNKYVSPSRLSLFLENLKTIFSPLTHTHKISEITDYVIDSELSSTSNNPVANSTINTEFDAVSEAMGALELAIDNHTHTVDKITDLSVTADELNLVSGVTSNVQAQLDALVSRIFVGTYEEYKTAYANNQIPINTIVILTDTSTDTGGGSSGDTTTDETTAKLGFAVLGKMVLG
jgi:hypothetical protein